MQKYTEVVWLPILPSAPLSNLSCENNSYPTHSYFTYLVIYEHCECSTVPSNPVKVHMDLPKVFLVSACRVSNHPWYSVTLHSPFVTFASSSSLVLLAKNAAYFPSQPEQCYKRGAFDARRVCVFNKRHFVKNGTCIWSYFGCFWSNTHTHTPSHTHSVHD